MYFWLIKHVQKYINDKQISFKKNNTTFCVKIFTCMCPHMKPFLHDYKTKFSSFKLLVYKLVCNEAAHLSRQVLSHIAVRKLRHLLQPIFAHRWRQSSDVFTCVFECGLVFLTFLRPFLV